MTIDTSHWGWRCPPFSHEGQTAFWDRQAPIYATANMTKDNEGEAVIVRTRSFEISNTTNLLDVVTLGGAVGCRDPLIVTDAMRTLPEKIFFNDLSEKMVEAARAGSLSGYDPATTSVMLVPGRIHEVAEQIPALPRRVLLGVYRASSLIKSSMIDGYQASGLDGYANSSEILGDTLLIEALNVKLDGSFSEPVARMLMCKSDGYANMSLVKHVLGENLKKSQANVIRVIGRHEGKDGYFLSHWYTETGVANLVRAAFTPERIGSLSIEMCAKGYVICIDPIAPAQGIVTMLNNVLGNIVPDEQVRTLRAIDRMSS